MVGIVVCVVCEAVVSCMPLPPQTVGYDPLVPAEEAAKFQVEFLELEQMWPVVDFITVHTPLIPQTRGEHAHTHTHTPDS